MSTLLILLSIFSFSLACEHGHYIQNSTCICEYGYIKWPKDNPTDCNYEQKKAGIPFACHIAVIGLFTGIGPYLLGRDDWGTAQLLLFWLFFVNLAIQAMALCFCGMFEVTAKVIMPWMGESKKKSKCETCIGVWNVLWGSAIVILWMTALILIGGGYMRDGNGASIVGL